MTYLRGALFILLSSLFLHISNALTILSPTPGEVLNLTDKFLVRWQEDSGEATELLSIDLVNTTAASTAPILLNIARNVSSTVGEVNVTWPLSVPNITATYQLYFLSTTTGSDIATSGTFNLTLPAGHNRTAGGGPVNPAVSSQNSASSTGLSGGAIAGIAVGASVGALAVLLAAWFFWRQKRRRAAAQNQVLDEKQDKPELDGTAAESGAFLKRDVSVDGVTSAELASPDKKHHLDPHEMEGSGDYLRFELPATPPAELEANEEAAREMYAPGKPGRPSSAHTGRGAASIRSGTTTLGGTRTFAEALHDLMSEELRRKE